MSLQPGRLAALAVAGYVLFLPWVTFLDLSTLLLLAVGLVALHNGFRPWAELRLQDAVVIVTVLAAAVLSTLLSEDPSRGLAYLTYLLFNVFLLLLAAGFHSRDTCRIVAGSLALFGCIQLAMLLISVWNTPPETASELVRQARSATLIVPNDALILGLCLPSLVYVLHVTERVRPLAAYALVIAYLVLSLYISYRLQSKLTLLGLGAALLIMAAASRFQIKHVANGKRHLIFLAGLVVVLVLLAVFAWYFGNQSTTRLSLWFAAASAHNGAGEWLFGAGPNSFVYNPQAVDSIFDKGNFVIPWVHNLYLEAFHDQGLVGLCGMLALTLIPIFRSLAVEDPALRTLLVASILTFCFLAVFEITLTRRFYFSYLMILYGLAAAHSKRSRA